MGTWSKSPEAQAHRAAARPREIRHYAGHDGRHVTACGRHVRRNSTMWLCSRPVDATCPRCVKALKKTGHLNEVHTWTVGRAAEPDALGTIDATCEGDALATAIERWDDGQDSKTLWVKRP